MLSWLSNIFGKKKDNNQSKHFDSSISFDKSKCINCMNCVKSCAKYSVSFLETQKDESNGKIYPIPSPNSKKDCIFCGQCTAHCPTGAFSELENIVDVKKVIADKSKVVVFQFAPSIRVSIGEEFNLPHGQVVTDQLAQAIRELGADYVFDTSVGADFTTNEEAKEMIEKISSDKCQILFSSCCPSWVKFIEFYYPEYISNIATARSPQMILAGLIKTYWAKLKSIDAKKIVNVSVMPCTSKKYEILRPENKVDGVQMIDYVITTRELAKMLKERNIDIAKISPKPADNPLGEPSGAGVIYGASGGVMESALRTAYCKMTGKCLNNIEFTQVRGMQGFKTAEININSKKIRVAVVNTIPNAKKILEELKQNPNAYSCVEVMACPGGCVGGGGQPKPVNDQIIQKRIEALYKIDKDKKVRIASENPILKQIYKEFLKDDVIIKKICHTNYSKKEKEVK